MPNFRFESAYYVGAERHTCLQYNLAPEGGEAWEEAKSSVLVKLRDELREYDRPEDREGSVLRCKQLIRMIGILVQTDEAKATLETKKGRVIVSGEDLGNDDPELFMRFACELSPDHNAVIKGAEFWMRYWRKPEGEYWEAMKGTCLRSIRHALRVSQENELSAEAQNARQMELHLDNIDVKTAAARTAGGRERLIKPTDG